ncbi:MAG: PTS fructose transporter subunit IIA [Candidatus Delongbacteria bacterium]
MSLLRALLITHGELGAALLATAEEILGPREGLAALSNRGLSRDGLVAELRARLAELPAEDGLLLLVDAPGASPHVAARLLLGGLDSAERGRVLGPLTGVNLPLLLTFLNRRATTPVEELLPLLVERGRAGILL